MESGKMKSLREDDLIRMIEVVNTMLEDPMLSNPTRRHQAHQSYEEIKRTLTADQKLELGAALSLNPASVWSPSVIHFGLQILEDMVKLQWPTLRPDQKLAVKNVAFELITSADVSGSKTESFILNGIAKIVVEMIKREWPQHWPTMLQEMGNLSRLGPLQIQIVVFVFKGFIEDLMQFRLLPQQRHRDLSEGLMEAMPEFIVFLVSSLNQATESNLRSVKINILQLCSTIGEFTQVKSLWENDGLLVDTLLFKTFVDESLQLEVGEFLYTMLSRKYSKKDDVKMVLRVFSENKYFSILLRIVSYAGPFSEQSYTTFKRFFETFIAISMQLSHLEELAMYLETNKDHFAQYIDALTRLTTHESPMVCNTALNAWLTIWGNKVLRERPEVACASLLQALLNACAKMLLLSKLTHSSVLLMDFGNQDQIFKEFNVGYRLRVSELIRRIAVCRPTEMLDFSFRALQRLLDTREHDQDAWVAVQTILDQTSRSVSAVMKTNYRQIAFQLVERLMSINDCTTGGAILTSMALSCISRLASAFIPNPPPEHQQQCTEMLDRVISYDLLLLTNTLTTSTAERLPDDPIVELHRHSSNFFSHFCRNLTKQLVDRYEQLLEMLTKVYSFPLTTNDRCILLDGLIQVTKDCNDVAKQSRLAGWVSAEVAEFWKSAEFCEALKSLDKFIKFFGFDQPISAGFDDPVVVKRRKQLFFCSHVVASTFVHMKFSDAPVISLLLENSFLLAVCFLQMRQPSSLSMIHKQNRGILDMPASERKNILRPMYGIFADDSGPDQVPVERLRNWFHGNFESICQIIGFAGRCLGLQFYQIPNLSEMLRNAVFRFTSMDEVVPLFVMRIIVRIMVSNFIRNCPQECYGTAVVPVLKQFCPSMFKLLNTHWDALDLESDEKEEILHETMLRSVTKDYSSLVLQPILCDQVKIPVDYDYGGIHDELMEDDSGASAHSPSPTSSSQPVNQPGKPDDVPEVSALGVLCLQEQVLATSILMTVFNGLHWPDTASSVVFTRFAQMIIPRLARKDDTSLSPDAVKYIMQSVLLGLKVHGEHEPNQAQLLNLGLHAYFHLKPPFPEAVESVLRPANCDMEKHRQAVEQLDALLFVRLEGKNLYEKRKKAAFRKIVVDHIGKPLSEMEKLNVFIPNLPPLRVSKASKKAFPTQDSEEILGLASVFTVNGR